MIVSKFALTMFAFRPITAASACIRSASMPMTVCPSGAMNSFGAYCASVATISVPLDLIAAGTCATTAGSAEVATTTAVVVVGVETVVLLELLLLLPQPASASRASAGTPMRATSLLIETSG